MHVHILGICGTLMGSIASLASALGHTVTGTDENIYPPMSDQLIGAGIEINSPYSAANVPASADLIVIGNANLPRGNPAVEYVLEQGLPYTSGAEWLGQYLLKDKWVIAVAGTHGKTTTTSMLAWILEYAGLSPGFLIGGVATNFSQSARLGETPFFVIEADEYDTSYFDRRSKFLHYRPRTVILNNLEYDHADIFPDLEAIQNQFHLLLRTIPGEGLVIHPANHTNIDEVLNKGCWSNRISFGNNGNLSASTTNHDCSQFTVLLNNQAVADVNWNMTGQHNISNALAAIAAARHIGVTPAIAAEALATFKGVKRRMETIYKNADMTVYDDFAHHPTAINTTLEGLRQQVNDAHIIAIIELGSHTMRMGIHAQQLKHSALMANETFWFQPPNLKWDMQAQVADQRNHIYSNIDQLIDAACLRSTSAATSIPQHIICLLYTSDAADEARS
ncbi:MAG: UDP-N-acetylmuramate:L-alanyl-gamma-D-glutamyl-meso-diaminopimelate ligase, partial [Pseudomonadales bacterium]|nr:UDP-N-acetylmuramate:L-alanyl-gamma-D-glutamyl-meso-diaminopimelate ligase [Pseudomonadales bacterium]